MGTSQDRGCLCLLRSAACHSLSLSSRMIHQHAEQPFYHCPAEVSSTALQTPAGTCPPHRLLTPAQAASEGRLATLLTSQAGELPVALESSKGLQGPTVGISPQQSQGHPLRQGQACVGFVSLWLVGSLPKREEQDDLHFMSPGVLLALPCAPAEAQLISPSSEVYTRTAAGKKLCGQCECFQGFLLKPINIQYTSWLFMKD